MKRLLSYSAAILLLSAVFLVLFTNCEKEELETLPEPILKGGKSGKHGGYYWGLYYEGGRADVSFPNSKSIKGTWSGVRMCGFGKGWKPGSIKKVTYVVDSRKNVHCNSVYGWTQNPLVEYYFSDYGSHSGTKLGTLKSDGKTYNCYKYQRVNKPSIEGTKTFWQAKSSAQRSTGTGKAVTVSMKNHFNFFKNKGVKMGSKIYDVLVYCESFSSSGSCQLTVGSQGSGDDGDDDNGGNNNIKLTLRARSTDGGGKVKLVVGGKTVGDWKLGKSMRDYSVTLWSSKGDCYVQFYNDKSGRDVQVDYLKVGNDRRQAEKQRDNSSVYQNGSCGGKYSEWMHCNGRIKFGKVNY